MLTWMDHPKAHVVIHTPHGWPAEPPCERIAGWELVLLWAIAVVGLWAVALTVGSAVWDWIRELYT